MCIRDRAFAGADLIVQSLRAGHPAEYGIARKLADGTYLDYIRSQYFRSAEKDPPFFREFVTYVLGIPFGAVSYTHL